jgi:hypothetical protein
MTLLVTLRRNQAPVVNTQVAAYVGLQECASAPTNTQGQATLSFPRVGSPSPCTQVGSPVRFRVNGEFVGPAVTYTPLSFTSIDLEMP